jgi:hypothetical protein
MVLWFIFRVAESPRAEEQRSTLPQKTDKPEPVDTSEAEALFEAYLSDQDKAGRDFRGRTVNLLGVVSRTGWSQDKKAGLFIKLGTARPALVITAWFDMKHEKAVLFLPKGLTVRVEGKVGDVGVNKERGEVFVSLDECLLVPM